MNTGTGSRNGRRGSGRCRPGKSGSAWNRSSRRGCDEAMIEPINILHLFGRMDRGGAEMRTLELMRHVDRDRFRLEFCALSGEAGDLDEEIRSLGGRVHLLRLGASFGWKFRRLLRERRFDVVQS